MFRRVSEWLGLGGSEASSGMDELHLATAALLVEVSHADGEFSAEERTQLQKSLTEHFGIEAAAAAKLLERAELDQADATCLYRFTRQITNELDQEGRQDIVKLMWRVALADHHLDNFEMNAVAKVAGLLGVGTSDRVRLKQEVEAELQA